LFWDPGKWHCAQTVAFEVFVSVWVYVGPCQGRAGCGERTPASWQEALLRHDTCDPPPEKFPPWQIWQEANPELPGAFFAETPCCCVAGGTATQPAAGP
jgi:hypothetical protein